MKVESYEGPGTELTVSEQAFSDDAAPPKAASADTTTDEARASEREASGDDQERDRQDRESDEQESPAETDEAGADDDKAASGEEEEQEKPPKPRPSRRSVQDRINHHARARYKAEARADQLQQELDRIRKDLEGKGRQDDDSRETRPARSSDQDTYAIETDPHAPKPEDFDSDSEYLAAATRYLTTTRVPALVQDAVKTERDRVAAEAAAERRDAELRDSLTAHEQRVIAAKEKYPDFDEKVEAAQESGTVYTNAMVEAIVASDQSGELFYHLLSHPDEATRLSEMNPVQVGRAIARLETRLEGGSSRPTDTTSEGTRESKTPPSSATTPTRRRTTTPITPVTGSASAVAQKDPSEMSTREYLDYMAKKERDAALAAHH